MTADRDLIIKDLIKYNKIANHLHDYVIDRFNLIFYDRNFYAKDILDGVDNLPHSLEVKPWRDYLNKLEIVYNINISQLIDKSSCISIFYTIDNNPDLCNENKVDPSGYTSQFYAYMIHLIIYFDDNKLNVGSNIDSSSFNIKNNSVINYELLDKKINSYINRYKFRALL